MVGAKAGFVDGDRALNIRSASSTGFGRTRSGRGWSGGATSGFGAERLLAMARRVATLLRPRPCCPGPARSVQNDKGCRCQGRLPARGPFRFAFKLSRQRDRRRISALLGQRRDACITPACLGAGLARPCNGACEGVRYRKTATSLLNPACPIAPIRLPRVCYRYAVGRSKRRPDSFAPVRAAFSKTCCGWRRGQSPG